MTIERLAQPAVEPVTLADFRAHTRSDAGGDDSYVEDILIPAARETCEDLCWRSFIETQWRLTLDEFPAAITVMRSRLLSVLSVRYRDTTGAWQTLAATEYQVDTRSEPGRITTAYGKSWPSTYNEMNAVEVNFSAGYGPNAGDVPHKTKLAILILAAHWFENRELLTITSMSADVKLSVESLLSLESVKSF